MRTRVLLPVLSLVSFVFGCGLGGETGTDATGGADAITYASPEEERYCKLADQFAQKLISGDFAAAYEMSSSHVKAAATLEQFTEKRKAEVAQFGKILKFDQAYGAEFDANLLRGPKHVAVSSDPLDAGITKLEAARAVGDIPDAIPFAARKAAIEISMYSDPPPQPGEQLPGDQGQAGVQDRGEEAEAAMDDFGDPNCYLHVVIVDDGGQLKVGHFFLRWTDILD
jgi:hypothetical protein